MGINYHCLALLLAAEKLGASFERVCLLGRQELHLTPYVFRSVLASGGHALSSDAVAASYADKYSENFLRQVMGAGLVDSYDASPYEGASRIHDMNQPLAEHETYSLVADFGTLEHCFHVPNAFANAIALCAPGGHILHSLPGNNFSGHGFYQFSPELFFSMYSRERGFKVKGVYLAMEGETRFWWKIRSPQEKHSRVEFMSSLETHVLVIVEKLAGAVTPLQQMPQQSDYAEGSWMGAHESAGVAARRYAASGTVRDELYLRGAFRPARLARRLVQDARHAVLGDPDFRRVRVKELISRPALG